jgi:N-acetylneuraminic acid mutarotase
MKVTLIALSAAVVASLSLPVVADCTWEPGPTFPGGPRTGAAGVNQNGTIIVLGGRPFVGGGSAAVHYLPPGATAWLSGPPLDGPVMHPGAGLDALGRVIVFGGYVIDDHFPFYFALTNGFVYDVAGGMGDGIAGMNFARAWFALAMDAQQRLYAIGGRDANGDPTDVAERYDAVADTWTVLAPLPEPRDHAAAVYDGEGHILVIGGAGVSGNPQTSVFSYDLANGIWSTIASQPTALQGQAAVLGANGRAYVLGGSTGSSETDAVYVYDPSIGEWSVGPSLITARSSAAVALDDDGFICAMGGDAGALGTDTVERLYTGVPDSAEDCNSNAVPDSCELAGNDCNNNGTLDECDIADGTSADVNGNGIPDECEAPDCPGDLDGDNDVDLGDLAQLLGNYGTTGGAAYQDGDLDLDGDVDLSDLADLLGVYGVTCG